MSCRRLVCRRVTALHEGTKMTRRARRICVHGSFVYLRALRAFVKSRRLGSRVYEIATLILLRGRGAGGLAAVAIVASSFGLRAELPEWVRNVEAGGRWHDAIFRTLPTPAGPREVRRSPPDAHDALTTVSGAATDRDLLALRAHAAEENLDLVAAEADWKAYASASTDIG